MYQPNSRDYRARGRAVESGSTKPPTLYSPPNNQFWSANQNLESETEALTYQLHQKAADLRSVSVRIGNELRDQNRFMDGMSESMNRSEGLLRSSMKRVFGITKLGSGGGLYCYLFAFAALVFFFCFLILRFFR